MVWPIAVLVLIVVVGVSFLAYRNRTERGIESGISSFRRELRALAPENDGQPRASGPASDPPRTSGVGVLRPDPDAAVPGGRPVQDDDDRQDEPDDDPGRGAG